MFGKWRTWRAYLSLRAILGKMIAARINKKKIAKIATPTGSIIKYLLTIQRNKIKLHERL